MIGDAICPVGPDFVSPRTLAELRFSIGVDSLFLFMR